MNFRWKTRVKPHVHQPGMWFTTHSARLLQPVCRNFTVSHESCTRRGGRLPRPRGRAYSTEVTVVTRSAVVGRVYLVGAGPGSPDLITLRGLHILQSADVILPDALVALELLQEAKPTAKIVPVGKRGYCIGSTHQETIHEAMIRYASLGYSVCRLKCGDPCIFGRGGEEAEVLTAADVPFEIVPGVTSAMGACADAGIPLTHRDHGQSLTFVTGHHDPDSPDCQLDWDTLAKLPTVVFYMAVRHIEKIAHRLTLAGMDPSTHAAVIESGTLPKQRVIDARLNTIGVDVQDAGITGPAIFVVGSVVGIRQKLIESVSRAGVLV